MTLAAGSGATAGGTSGTAGTAATTTGPEYYDPFKVLVSAIFGSGAIIVGLLLYIWHDTTSRLEKNENAVSDLYKITTRIDTHTNDIDSNNKAALGDIKDNIKVIQNDIKDLLKKQTDTGSNIEKSINAAKEEIIRSIRARE